MSYSLLNQPTADTYSAGTTLVGGGIKRLVISVANATAYYQLGIGWANPNWQPEQFLLPGIYTLERTCDGIRFRSGATGVPARITVEAATEGDVG